MIFVNIARDVSHLQIYMEYLCLKYNSIKITYVLRDNYSLFTIVVRYYICTFWYFHYKHDFWCILLFFIQIEYEKNVVFTLFYQL